MKTKATIYRMVTPDHYCPWGIKAWDLLKRNGYDIEDKHLESMDANRQFKEDNGVDETPQIYIDGEHLGGYDQLREHLGLGPDPKEGKSIQPVIAIFAVAFAMALSTCWAFLGNLVPVRIIELFVAFIMCILGVMKLQNLQSFANGFIQYDMLARRYVPYAALYAFIETIGGVLMISGLLIWVVAPIVLMATTVGAISIIRSVYIDKRELDCACVGGGSNVPLGFLSLSENLMMMGMAVWMMVSQI
jgi:glutaredoxin/uncharacterized membrane protein YphA (DoxX/SURF4 family)